jgi:hypothetical protein
LGEQLVCRAFFEAVETQPSAEEGRSGWTVKVTAVARATVATAIETAAN